jgi:hypothetical protein
MTRQRRSLPVDVRRLVLHESGYKCGNPACHSILTIDIHHMERVADDGSDAPDNLLPLCPNCHALHHKGEIPIQSVRAWKMLLLTINEAYDRKTIDVLAALGKVGTVFVSGDGLLTCAGLVAAGLVEVSTWGQQSFDPRFGFQIPSYRVTLTPRGDKLLAAWRAGDQAAAVASTSDA